MLIVQNLVAGKYYTPRCELKDPCAMVYINNTSITTPQDVNKRLVLHVSRVGFRKTRFTAT